jgi:hypothetical protein
VFFINWGLTGRDAGTRASGGSLFRKKLRKNFPGKTVPYDEICKKLLQIFSQGEKISK